VTAEEEFSDGLVTEFGDHSATVRELGQRVGRGKGIAGEGACLESAIAGDVLRGRAQILKCSFGPAYSPSHLAIRRLASS
jgi:hypothetical protein